MSQWDGDRTAGHEGRHDCDEEKAEVHFVFGGWWIGWVGLAMMEPVPMELMPMELMLMELMIAISSVLRRERARDAIGVHPYIDGSDALSLTEESIPEPLQVPVAYMY
jgi:hypothetical protein